MSKYRGLIFEGFSPRTPLGTAAPADALPDMSRYGNDGVFTDAPSWVQLPSGLWVLQFVNADTNYIILPGVVGDELDMGSKPFTMMVWANPDSWANAETPIFAGNSNSAALQHDINGQLKSLKVGINANGSGLIIPIGTWSLVGYTFEPFTAGTNQDFFVNEDWVADTWDFSFANTTDNISRERGIAGRYFDGSLTLPRIFNYKLTRDQINAHYAAERSLFGV